MRSPRRGMVLKRRGGAVGPHPPGRAGARRGAGPFGPHEVAGPLGLPVQEGASDAAVAHCRVHGAGHGGVDLPGRAQAYQPEGAHDAVGVAPGDPGVGGVEEVLGRLLLAGAVGRVVDVLGPGDERGQLVVVLRAQRPPGQWA